MYRHNETINALQRDPGNLAACIRGAAPLCLLHTCMQKKHGCLFLFNGPGSWVGGGCCCRSLVEIPELHISGALTAVWL